MGNLETSIKGAHYANLSLSVNFVQCLGTSLVMYLLHNAPERLLGCGLVRVGQITNDVWQNIVDGISLQTKFN